VTTSIAPVALATVDESVSIPLAAGESTSLLLIVDVADGCNRTRLFCAYSIGLFCASRWASFTCTSLDRLLPLALSARGALGSMLRMCVGVKTKRTGHGKSFYCCIFFTDGMGVVYHSDVTLLFVTGLLA
jgi:hypothetical protein